MVFEKQSPVLASGNSSFECFDKGGGMNLCQWFQTDFSRILMWSTAGGISAGSMELICTPFCVCKPFVPQPKVLKRIWLHVQFSFWWLREPQGCFSRSNPGVSLASPAMAGFSYCSGCHDIFWYFVLIFIYYYFWKKRLRVLGLFSLEKRSLGGRLCHCV